jgi:hypothetical protein
VPPKVHISAWKLSLDGLATQCNRKKRNLTEAATCHSCGCEDESGYHAIVQCTKAKVLRMSYGII